MICQRRQLNCLLYIFFLLKCFRWVRERKPQWDQRSHQPGDASAQWRTETQHSIHSGNRQQCFDRICHKKSNLIKHTFHVMLFLTFKHNTEKVNGKVQQDNRKQRIKAPLCASGLVVPFLHLHQQTNTAGLWDMQHEPPWELHHPGWISTWRTGTQTDPAGEGGYQTVPAGMKNTLTPVPPSIPRTHSPTFTVIHLYVCLSLTYT